MIKQLEVRTDLFLEKPVIRDLYRTVHDLVAAANRAETVAAATQPIVDAEEPGPCRVGGFCWAILRMQQDEERVTARRTSWPIAKSMRYDHGLEFHLFITTNDFMRTGAALTWDDMAAFDWEVNYK